MTTVSLEVLYYDKSRKDSKIDNEDCDTVIIYDAGDSFAEHNISKNEWKYWQIIDSEVEDSVEGTYIARIIRFIGYDIVPSNILTTYNVKYKDTMRGEWMLIQSLPWKAEEPLPPSLKWKSTNIQKISCEEVQSKKRTYERPQQIRQQRVERKERPQQPRQHQKDLPQHPSPHPQHVSLHEQLLTLQKLQQQILSQQLGLQQQTPKPSQPLQQSAFQSLVPLIKPGSSSLIPLVPSSLLPARTIL